MSNVPRPPGFLPTLLDASFRNLLTLRLVRVLYLCALIVVGTTAFFLLFAGFSGGARTAVSALLMVPVLALLVIGLVRVVLEAAVIVFRMGEHSERMSESLYRISTTLRADDRRHDD